MDYRKFLAAKQQLVLPYFGGARVEAENRTLQVSTDGEPGWWRFEIQGRRASFIERVDPGDLSSLPSVRGHWAQGWLFSSGQDIERISLPPADEPEPLAPCTARRWYSGDLLLDSVEFEDEAEDGARRALEEGRALSDIKGISPALRAAYGFSLSAAVGRETGIRISPREVAAHVLQIAEGGRVAALDMLHRMEQERAEYALLQRDEALLRQARRARPTRVTRDPIQRCDAALDAAGARMLRGRSRADGQLEIAFTFMGERFISIVDEDTLQVYDAGICLSGADRELTLESLPSVIREAIRTHRLCITRH
jgi:hypothetical protein